MKRVQYFHYGAPQELRLDEAPPPDVGRGQIRVQVRAASANPMDRKIRRGEMKALSGFRFPRGLGHDFAGVVEAVGPGVERLKVGDEVFGVTSIRQAGAFCRIRCRGRKKRWAQAAILLVRAGGRLYHSEHDGLERSGG
jgi:NADPH:quinone reductase-like Zn-dependent oxidoreductase